MDIVDLLTPESPQFEIPFRTFADSNYAPDSRAGKMMLEFIDSLRKMPTGPLVFAQTLQGRELWLSYSAPGRRAHAQIIVTIDSPDYGPLENGLPKFHYRMSCLLSAPIDTSERSPTEARVRSVESACEFVRDAIEEARRRL